MNIGKYVFSQIIELLSHKRFQALVKRHAAAYQTKDFTCWKQFLCMACGQLTHRESISDTVMCLTANSDKLYHLGIGKIFSISTLTRANENRSYLIYEELAMQLIKEATHLYINDDKLDINLKGNVCNKRDNNRRVLIYVLLADFSFYKRRN